MTPMCCSRHRDVCEEAGMQSMPSPSESTVCWRLLHESKGAAPARRYRSSSSPLRASLPSAPPLRPAPFAQSRGFPSVRTQRIQRLYWNWSKTKLPNNKCSVDDSLDHPSRCYGIHIRKNSCINFLNTEVFLGLGTKPQSTKYFEGINKCLNGFSDHTFLCFTYSMDGWFVI